MAAGSRIQVEGKFTQQAVNQALQQISDRLDRLEGKTGPTTRRQPLMIHFVDAEGHPHGRAFEAANLTFNRYGADFEKSAIAHGAYVNTEGQWIAITSDAIIIEFVGDELNGYADTGLTPGAPFDPTFVSNLV